MLIEVKIRNIGQKEMLITKANSFFRFKIVVVVEVQYEKGGTFVISQKQLM